MKNITVQTIDYIAHHDSYGLMERIENIDVTNQTIMWNKESISLEECKLMAYSGHRDAHGKKIYNNQIIQTASGKYQVVVWLIDGVKDDGTVLLVSGFYAYDSTKKKYMTLESTDVVVGDVFDDAALIDTNTIEELREKGLIRTALSQPTMSKVILDEKHFLMTISIPTNYGTEVMVKMLATKKEVDNAKFLAGEEISFGEIEGKHSEVYGTFRLSNINTIELSDKEYKLFKEHMGKYISDYNLFNYYEAVAQEDLFGTFLDYTVEFIESMSDEDQLRLKKYLAGSNTYMRVEDVGSYSFYQFMFEIFSFSDAYDWNEKLEEKELEGLEQMDLNVILESRINKKIS